MIKAVFFDVDGTLVSFKTHQVPISTLRAIEELQRKGIKVFVATGRHPSILSAGNDVDKIDFDGFITLNGQYSYTKKGETIYKSYMDENDVRDVIKYIDENDITCGFVGDTEYFVNKITPRVLEATKSVNLDRPTVKPSKFAKTIKIFQVNPYIDSDGEEEFLSYMPHSAGTRWTPLFMDIIPKNGGKHISIEKIAEKYGYKRSEIMAFGDGGNDISMIEYAGIGVAMGNATENLKSVADYITKSVDDEGVLYALKHFKIL